MEAEQSLKSQLSDTYHRTLELAKGITRNRYQFFDEEINKDHERFIKRISKGCRDYKELTSKYTKQLVIEKPVKTIQEDYSDYIIKSNLGHSKDSGKLKLSNLVDETYKLAKKTKTGKGGIRHMTPSPPPAITKLRNNKSVFSDYSENDDRPLAYVSLINGKTEEIELPSFRDCIKGNRRIDSDSELVLSKIDKCQENLCNFEKRMNGLEVFCKYNPGVRWNNDKKLLMKLSSNQYNRNALLKAYNEKKPTSSSGSSKRFSVIGNFNKPRTRSPDRITKIQMPLIEEKRSGSIQQRTSRTNLLQANCVDGFQQIKSNLNTKTLQILAKLRAERPVYLRAKAELILADNESYKGKIHSFQKFESIKKKVEKSRYSFVEKCKSQVKVYTRLLDYLKKYKGMPAAHLISFVETIKELIEGGWALDAGVVNEVLELYTEEEIEDLKPLVELMSEFNDEALEACM